MNFCKTFNLILINIMSVNPYMLSNPTLVLRLPEIGLNVPAYYSNITLLWTMIVLD